MSRENGKQVLVGTPMRREAAERDSPAGYWGLKKTSAHESEILIGTFVEFGAISGLK